MKEKILELFKYRKLPFLLKTLSKKDRRFLEKQLFEIQKSIYDLDAYLESNWKIKDKKIKKLWKNINQSIADAGFDDDEIYSMTSHIRKYQLHELQLRDGKLPTRLKLEYFYYYKSCDVRLMRDIIYAFNPDLNQELPLSDWRLYDLVTEINDDVEDVFEDQHTINGNCFLIYINEIGIEKSADKFLNYLDLLASKSIRKFSNAKTSHKLRIHFNTIKRIEETKLLLNENVEKIRTKGLVKKSILYENLKK